MLDKRANSIQARILLAFVFLGLVMSVGTTGYWFISERQASLLDCFYFTMITISTIGFTEVIDLTGNPAGRMFTVALALLGIGSLTYILSNFTAYIVEGELNEAWRRKKMQKKIDQMSGHYILCGVGVEGVGWHIMEEMRDTRRPFVVVEKVQEKIDSLLEDYPGQIYLHGDATDNDIQLRAGIKRARGVFATTGDDNENLVITLTAKQLNPGVKVVARSRDEKNLKKMTAAGADDVVLTTRIGGLRMASVMLRPAVVSFLDIMLRDDSKLRIEEMEVPPHMEGRALSDLKLEKYPGILLLAVRQGEQWLYNPKRSYQIRAGDVLICMATPDQRDTLNELMST